MHALLCRFEQQLMLFLSFAILLGSVELATANPATSNEIAKENSIGVKR